MSVFRKTWLIWTICAGLSLAGGILLPFLAIRRPPEVVDDGGHLMYEVLQKVLANSRKEDILPSLGPKKREQLEEHKSAWLDDAFPVQTKAGTIKPTYLPPYHVIVHGNPVLKQGDFTTRYVAYYGLWSQMRCQSLAELNKLIRTTRYGISQILLGQVWDAENTVKMQDLDVISVRMYLVLKKLIAGDEDYIGDAISLSESGSRYRMNDWIEKILTESILSPTPPDLNPNYPKEFYEGWMAWYEKNTGKITFTNRFLLVDPNGTN